MPHDSTATPDRYNDGDYLANNTSWHAEDSPWKAGQIEKFLLKNQIAFDTLCEVGCGAGEILQELSQKPPFKHAKFTGYEVSKDAYGICSSKANASVSYHLKNILEEDVFYDVALCIDVFEHVEDYMGFLRALRSKAKYKIFHIPLDLSVSTVARGTLSGYRQSIGHLHYFTAATARDTLKDCGYRLLDTMFTPKFADYPSRTLVSKLARLPRHILWRISPELMATWLGGCSLMVLAE